MKVNRTLTGILIVAAVAGLSACGGGGSSDPVAYVPIPAIEAPPPSDTGLSASPNKVLNFSDPLNQLGAVLIDVNASLTVAPYANAAATMARVSPTTGCTTGTLVVGGATNPLYTFNQCQVDGHVFDGTATLIPGSGSAYTFDFAGGMSVTPKGGTARQIKGSAACDVSTLPRCVITIESDSTSYPTCTFGYDAVYQNGMASGTQYCQDGATTWLVTLVDMSSTGGPNSTGLLQASNGEALIRRNSPNLWDVELTSFADNQTRVYRDLEPRF